MQKTAPRESISPAPVRRERGRLSQSRTMRGGGLAGGGIATAGTAMAIDRVYALSGQVSWLPSVLAGVVVIALVAALIGVAVVLYARRDDFLRASE